MCVIYRLYRLTFKVRNDDSEEAQKFTIDRHVVNKRDWCASLDPICRQGFAEGSPLTARSANTSNFTIHPFSDQAYKLPSALCVQGPGIEAHPETTAYVIAEWHLLSSLSLQRRRNGSTAPLCPSSLSAHAKLIILLCRAGAEVVLTLTRCGQQRAGRQYARKVICRGVGCQHEAARDLRVREMSSVYIMA